MEDSAVNISEYSFANSSVFFLESVHSMEWEEREYNNLVNSLDDEESYGQGLYSHNQIGMKYLFIYHPFLLGNVTTPVDNGSRYHHGLTHNRLFDPEYSEYY